jgi:hypothetical protein
MHASKAAQLRPPSAQRVYVVVNPEKVYTSRLSAIARDPTLRAMRAEGSLLQYANRNFPCPLWIQAVLGSLSDCQVGMDAISTRLI